MDILEKKGVTVEKILRLLPQTQCGHCGFDNCRMYAEAIATANADINRCATGGQTGIHMLAELLNVCEPVLDASCGVEKPYAIAEMDESRCTGCTLCLQTCPVDAIVGTGKMMHTVISSCCTGCERCLERCPMNCIEMKPVSGEKTGWDAWSFRQAQQARERYERRSFRLQQEKENESVRPSALTDKSRKSDTLRKIMERAKARSKTPGTMA